MKLKLATQAAGFGIEHFSTMQSRDTLRLICASLLSKVRREPIHCCGSGKYHLGCPNKWQKCFLYLLYHQSLGPDDLKPCSDLLDTSLDRRRKKTTVGLNKTRH